MRAFAIGGLAMALCVASAADAAEYIAESPRDIPVARDVDVIVAGGSSGAVAAACEAARQGARVFLLAPRPYLGTDLCATLRLWLEDGERATSELAAACFASGRVATPYAVKAAMDRALLDAGVPYLTGCYVTDLLRDREGKLAGVVMANRSGRQAVVGKVIVDATRHAVVARLAGSEFRPFVPGLQTSQRVVVGGDLQKGEGLSGRTLGFTCDSTAPGTRHRLPVHEYTLRLNLESGGPRAFLRAEQRARDMTYAQGSELASETLHYVPSDTIVGAERLDAWPGAQGAPLGPFQPEGSEQLFVLNAYADLSPAAMERLLRPVELMAVGARIGRAAASEAARVPAPSGAHLPATNVSDGLAMAVGEDLGGIRSTRLGTVRAGRRSLPVLGRYDVVVVGGGTSGCPAGIASAKSGAKTLVVEYLHELGGVGTVGLIGSYWRGLRRGFTAYVDQHVATKGKGGSWNAVEKAEWLRRELIGAGADVWFGVLGCGAIVDEGRVRGVVVATPWGRGAVLADAVVDATGNADIAACAGAQTQYSISDRGCLNVQVAGFPDRPMKKSYVNTCYTLVDDTDVLDVWHLMVWRRTTSPKGTAFDVGQLVDSRERRRIVGDAVLRTHDILNRRTFPDTISQHRSNFDAAAFPDADLLLLASAKGPDFQTDLPYRCLLPKGLDGILVGGLGCSADRDAMTLIRMQADLQNQGYAAGLAAAEAARKGGNTRDIDIRALQKRLGAFGCLDERVLTDEDSYPMPAERIREAASALAQSKERRDLLGPFAAILAHPEQARPLLRERYARAAGAAKVRYAQILAILGDPAGATTLAEAIGRHDSWDRGVPLTSERKTGNTYSDLDRLVIALGCSRATEALPPLIAKLKQLEPDSRLSHYKAIALALRQLPPSAAVVEPLATLLEAPGFSGHATVAESAPAVSVRYVTSGTKGASVNRAYKELIVAGLLYRSGDRDGVAKGLLEQYALDIHGHFARYARAVLAGDVRTRGAHGGE